METTKNEKCFNALFESRSFLTLSFFRQDQLLPYKILALFMLQEKHEIWYCQFLPVKTRNLEMQE
jgi:hypothetical protein